MPRFGRLVIPNYPHHIVHRGHNKMPIFSREEEYSYYLANLVEWKENLRCRLYAYCLMDNHVHLVIDPGDDAASLAKLMKRLAGRQTRHYNSVFQCTGTLWEGRYRSSVICKDTYLLACCRYVELNPVRAGMVRHPAEYRWSSYRDKMHGFDVVDADPAFLALGANAPQRKEAYEKWVVSAIPEAEASCIRDGIRRGALTGGAKLHEEVAGLIGLQLDVQRQGRPRRKSH